MNNNNNLNRNNRNNNNNKNNNDENLENANVNFTEENDDAAEVVRNRIEENENPEEC